MQVGTIRKAKNELIANRRQECSMLVIVGYAEEARLGLSRMRKRSSRLFSSHVLSVMLLLWKGCRVGDGWSVQQCFEASNCWLR